MASYIAKSILSPDEYLEIEDRSESRHEYLAGEIFAMAGANRNHNRIVSNMVVGLGTQLKDRPCNVYANDMRVRVEEADLYTYPDIVITCGEERFAEPKAHNLLNPQIIIEVLSNSTEAYDRGKKFEFYQQLESLREYILISQNSYRVEQYVKQEAQQWLYFEAHGLDGNLTLPSIDCRLMLQDIYVKVMIPEKPNLRLVVREADSEC